MRILLLVHSFNSLAQRLHVELGRDGHELSVEFDIHDRVTEEAVALFRPELVIAPFLKRAIPASVWQHHRCLVVHPGPPGDRGPSALDWAILRGRSLWGVTVLQADAEMDAGAVWASQLFPMRAATKSSLYRHEVTQSAVIAVREAIARITAGASPLSSGNRACDGEPGWQPAMKQSDRLIDWAVDDSAAVLRKINSADGFPGIEDVMFGQCFRMFDGRPAEGIIGRPGAVVGCNDDAICRATADGAVWIGQLQPVGSTARGFKRPAMRALGPSAKQLPHLDQDRADGHDGEIRYEESARVGYLSFDLYNGALSTGQCHRLRAAYARARERPTRVIVLTGGPDFWCNGMHLHCIEAADSPAEASWANINAIDDLAHDILATDSHLTVAALRGNAAAGGVFLALAADRVMARSTVVLNAHYRNMGNLYGSEYWTYLLPRRVGAERARDIMASRLPLGAAEALALGLIDDVAGVDAEGFVAFVEAAARKMAEAGDFQERLKSKRDRRSRDEQERALATYRDDELRRMQLNFFGFDPSYHIARHRFVHRDPLSWTPLHLARHRRSDLRSNAVAST
ncbi:MAG TPA: enoyl-CoA hydratase-related protein [Caldimonas sp.]